MNTQPEIPPVLNPHLAITYELTRWDVFVHWMTTLFRNRMLQVFVLVIFLLNGFLTLSPKLLTDSPFAFVFDAVFYVAWFFGFLTLSMGAMGLAYAYIPKHVGVLGRHVLEITDQGLMERTDTNETLHRWPGVRRIVSLWGTLYVYVSETNSHMIPKKRFAPEEINNFETNLRQRMVR